MGYEIYITRAHIPGRPALSFEDWIAYSRNQATLREEVVPNWTSSGGTVPVFHLRVSTGEEAILYWQRDRVVIRGLLTMRDAREPLRFASDLDAELYGESGEKLTLEMLNNVEASTPSEGDTLRSVPWDMEALAKEFGDEDEDNGGAL